MYDFETPVDRHPDHSIKYHAGCMEKDAGILPMWVADMDFPTLPEVSQALSRLAEFGIFGYTSPWKTYRQAVCGWMKRRFDWKIEPDWIVEVPGIVPALKILIQALTKPEEEILIFPPVYHPFAASVEQLGRRVVTCPLGTREGRYFLDFDRLESLLAQSHVKMMIFCSPQNPTGNVWSRDDLQRLGDLCKKHDILCISDEIHMDFARHGKHVPFLKACPQMADQTVIATAPSKTFNLAALQVSNLIIPSAAIREKVKEKMDENGMSAPNLFGLTACEAAYEYGDQWVDELNETIEGHMQLIHDWLQENLPALSMQVPEGLYLGWIDCRNLPVDPEHLSQFFIENARVWFNEGADFGMEGKGFVRINAACPRQTVLLALERMKKAVLPLMDTV